MKTFKQKEIKTLNTEKARQLAIEWQQWASEQNLSYNELYFWGNEFTKIAKKFHLVREFKENGII